MEGSTIKVKLELDTKVEAIMKAKLTPTTIMSEGYVLVPSSTIERASKRLERWGFDESDEESTELAGELGTLIGTHYEADTEHKTAAEELGVKPRTEPI